MLARAGRAYDGGTTSRRHRDGGAADPTCGTFDQQRAAVEASESVERSTGGLDARLERDGLCHHEFLILWCLTQHRDRTHTMGSLAELSQVTPSHLSRLASRLEKQGRLARERDSSDTRVTVASLTEEGSRQYAETAPGYCATLREHLFDRLTEEQAAQLGGTSAIIARSLAR